MAGNGQKEEAGAAAGTQRVFINHLAVEVSLSEFSIDMGQSGPGGAPAKLYRFVTTPHHFQQMQRKFDRAAGSYLAKFGPISQQGFADGEGSDG